MTHSPDQKVRVSDEMVHAASCSQCGCPATYVNFYQSTTRRGFLVYPHQKYCCDSHLLELCDPDYRCFDIDYFLRLHRPGVDIALDDVMNLFMLSLEPFHDILMHRHMGRLRGEWPEGDVYGP